MRTYEEDGYLITEYDSGTRVKALIQRAEFGTSLARIRAEKIKELNETCEKLIVDGITYNGKKYDFDRDTQLNMLGWQSKIIFCQLNEMPVTTIPWYAQGESCEDMSVNDFIALCGVGEQHKSALITECKRLKEQVNLMSTIEDIRGVMLE